MKILMLISNYFPNPFGGMEIQCQRQAEALVARGHEIIILTEWLNHRHPRKEKENGITVIRYGRLLPVYALGAKISQWADRKRRNAWGKMLYMVSHRLADMTNWLRRLSIQMEIWLGMQGCLRQADIVYVHGTYWFAGFAYYMGRYLQAPVFCKESTSPPLPNRQEKAVPFIKRWAAAKKNIHYIALTKDIVDGLIEKGIPQNKINKIPNGINIPDAQASPAAHTTGIFVGNFTQGAQCKAFDIIIQAVAQISTQEPAFQLTICGGGDACEWREMARRLGCERNVIFAGRCSDITERLKQSGFFILPSRQEGLSNALLEAMAAGLPVIVSDIAANTEVARRNVDGLVVPVGDASALANAMLKLYRDPELRKTFGKNARNRIIARYELNKIAQQLEVVFQTAIERGHE